jgi:hypothetical protein
MSPGFDNSRARAFVAEFRKTHGQTQSGASTAKDQEINV